MLSREFHFFHFQKLFFLQKAFTVEEEMKRSRTFETIFLKTKTLQIF